MAPTLQPVVAAHSRRRAPQGLRSLTLKLTLAFLAVGLLSVLLVSFFARSGAHRAFDQFVSDREHPALKAHLAQHYQANGSWKDVGPVFERNAPPR